jgi:hypothetical protein
MGGILNTHGGHEKYVQNFCRKNLTEEISWVI